MAAVGALLVSSGIALMVAPASTAAETDCVPTPAYTETTDWVAQSPGEGWVQVDVRTKTPAVEGHWVDLVWHNYAGPPPEGTPSVDDPNWHAVEGNPQSENHTVPPRVPGVPYNVSNDENGRDSWFLWTGTWVPAADAVYEYKFSFDHPAVTCEVTPPVVSPPVVSPPVEAPVEESTTVETPTVVHAGLAGTVSSSTGQEGLALILAGLLLMAGAGGLVVAKGGERR